MTRDKENVKVPGLMEDPVPRLLGGREPSTVDDHALAERANRFIDETRSGFKHMFIEQAPTHLLRRTIDLAASSDVAQKVVSTLVAKHTFRGYLGSSPAPGEYACTFTDADCAYLEYALAIAAFAVRLENGDGGELIHDYIIRIINDTYSDLEEVHPIEERVATGKAYCLIVWVKDRNPFQPASINTMERAYDMPFIKEHIDELEARLPIVVARGSIKQEDLQVLLDAHPALGDGAL